jgi:elongation factor Ts
MTAITANLVKELRDKTGAGMMECKSALAEAGGDVAKAEDILRIKGGGRAAKLAGRIAGEGAIGAYLSADAKTGALVELNCESDFVAKSESFVAFARRLAELVVTRNPADVAALMGLEGVDEQLQSMLRTIKENISVRRFERMQASAKLASYVHGNRIGVLVDFEGEDDLGKDLAMHISFTKPAYLNRDQVPGEVVARERTIAEARAKESGKPPEIVARMVEGGVNKFLGEVTLLGQPFIKDDKGQTVDKVLKARKGRIAAYRFLVVGEGIEKKSADFAAEVSAMAEKAR